MTNTLLWLEGFLLVLKCNECGRNFRGLMLTCNHRTKMRRPWYCCSSLGVSYIKCNNKYVKADVINKQAWDIIDTISKNLHVIEELSDVIKLSATEPEQKSIEDLEAKEKDISRNLEKQKGLYEVFSEDKINIDIYKDRAELLRNEEKRFRQDVKTIQLKILEKRNSVNLVKATQDFLLCLRSNPNTEKMDYLIKTFMRIIFKGIYIQNTEIVKVDINEPWKMCYEQALKMDSRFRGNDDLEKGAKCQKKRRISTEESVYCCAPSDDQWVQYYTTIVGYLGNIW